MDKPDRNGNVYPREVWERALEEYKRGHAGDVVLGDVSHLYPDDSMKPIGFMLKEVRIQGDSVVGKMVVLETQAGRYLRRYLEDGGKFSLGASGTGRREPDGIVSNYSLEGVTLYPTPKPGS